MNTSAKALAQNAGAFVFLLLLSGCATVASSLDRQAGINDFGRRHGFVREAVPTSFFKLTAFSKIKKQGEPLHIYIEGDGRAWLSKTRISDDPTPFHAMALELASKDPAPNVVYLARPCQFTPMSEEPHYDSDYWSTKRFSKEVIDSENEAIDFFKQKSGARKVELTGYSGGAAVAVLICARRQDIQALRTVAGNLDPEALNRHHRVDSLDGSLDPMDAAYWIAKIPQRHFIGGKDKIVPPFIVNNFALKMGPSNVFSITAVKDASHTEGWVEKWPALLALPLESAENSVVE